MKESDIFHKVGQFITYIYTFKDGNNYLDEYIHCIILEHLKLDRDGSPEKIKVLQIHNLEDYSNGIKHDVKERELTVSKIKIFINYRSV